MSSISASISTSSRCSGRCIGSLRDPRQCRCAARARSILAKAHANDEEQREEEIAKERIAEKHPGRCRAVRRQADSERLNQARKILHVAGIAQPGKDVGNHIENCRSKDRSGQHGFERCAVLEKKSDSADQDEREVASNNLRINERGAVAIIKNQVGNEQRAERKEELQLGWEINCAAQRYRSQREEVRQPGDARLN